MSGHGAFLDDWLLGSKMNVCAILCLKHFFFFFSIVAYSTVFDPHFSISRSGKSCLFEFSNNPKAVVDFLLTPIISV